MTGRAFSFADPFAYESVTVSTSTNGYALSSTTYASTATDPAAVATLTLDGGAIRYRIDGGIPSTALGHLMSVGDSLTLSGYLAISQFKAYAQTSTAGTLHATYEK